MRKPRLPLRLLGARAQGSRLTRWLSAPLSLVFSTAVANAQNDINPPLPNVMLLVDTSGSMESKLDGTGFPACFADGSQPSERSRWIDLVEVLTGTIQDYRCQAVDRSSAAFVADYDANGSSGERPYDYLYATPYHRPMSADCVAVPGVLPSNAYAFPDDDPATTTTYEGAIRYRQYTSTTGTCNFRQSTDGVLDAFSDGVRFGLMTFDSLSNPNTGVSGTTPNYDEGLLGTWSYVWGDVRRANPAGCPDQPLPFEVGARNAAAPPWEGRMVAFGDPDDASRAYLTKKSHVERILLATRPFGGTPIAGMMHDARDFFLNDTSADPLNAALKFGPKDDPYVDGGCRDQFVILLTDGQPNLDMRPHCEGAPLGVCPFPDKPDAIAEELVSQDHPIETLVVPFALPRFQLGGDEMTCNDLEESDFDETDPSVPCGDANNKDNVALQACCTLNRIAVAGSRSRGVAGARPRAFFAETRQELASQLSRILTSSQRLTSRTQPVMTGAVGNIPGLRFISGLSPVPVGAWTGVLQRQRFLCGDTNVATPKAVTPSEGDDFVKNMAQNPGGRVFATIQAGSGSEAIESQRTIRPFYEASSAEDGGGEYVGRRVIGDRLDFISDTTPESMEITNATCEDLSSASQCRDRFLRWLVGLPGNHGEIPNRCPSQSQCELLGDILHSTPRVVGPPSDIVRDETYDLFKEQQRNRKTVLYTSTNDGFLHAFDTTVDTLVNNELWAFVPPAILPRLRMQYPFTHQELLDGVPVIKDVVATHAPSLDVDDLRFERSGANAELGANDSNTWRTVLVQSFGAKRGGYFALDVTDPVPTATDDKSKGPRFLWQLTQDEDGEELFGIGGATPLITTLFFTPPGALSPLEIAVAVLPGGGGGEGTAGPNGVGCPETPRAFTGYDALRDFEPRGRVRCYGADGVGGRSLTIVRLDTGEIIRTFRQSANEIANADLKARVTEVGIDSPITGQPVATPSATGAVANRVYVGDQDGRVWRVNVTSLNPANWNMELFFDAFPASRDTVPTMHDFDDGQPILIPPVLSVDEAGNITMNVATGDQQTLGHSPGMTNYVWSLTERVDLNGGRLPTQVNWYQPLEDGARVTGSLVLFNSGLFFSTFQGANPGDGVCQNGESLIWGLDYIRPLDFRTNPNPPIDQGGDKRLPKGATVVQFDTPADPNSVIFGVSVAQVPTCSTVTEEPGSDFFGNYQTSAITNVNPGQFQLVMHRGGVATKQASGSAADTVETRTLPQPISMVRIDSWAALLE